jgi:endonuclease/exonuclease/phosphatase family metal-dependent hydrolase
VAFDPYAPYGPLVTSSLRVVSWNVWGRYGTNWAERQGAIEDELVAAAPDVVCLVETWRAGDVDQPALVATRLGFDHHCFVGDWEQEDWISGAGFVSRWPLGPITLRPLRGDDGAGFGEVLHVEVNGERGPLQLFLAMLDYPLDASARRQAQARTLAAFVQEIGNARHPTVVCGDFNAGPDSDELRLLTGQAATAVPGLVFYDAWEMAGDGTPGHTWSNRNPLAATGLYPDRRFDYVLSAWPRAGGVGHPLSCALLGVRPPRAVQLSDHYGVVADLRY